MSCCAAGTEGALEAAKAEHSLPPPDELWLASRPLQNGLRQTDLSVPGVHCGACITAVEKALKALPEVERARVNLSTKRVTCVWKEEFDGKRTNPSRLAEAIEAAGYESHLFSAVGEEKDEGRNALLRAVGVAGFAAMNIMLLSVSVWSGADAATRDLFHWISAAIAGPALIYSGKHFYVSAYRALSHGRMNMDVPIVLAVSLSYAMSLYETIHHGAEAYFDASVSLLFFLLIGRTLDHVMRDRARSAITSLARLSPRGATVLTDDGLREYREVSEIVRGDRMLVAVGERVPVDCEVVSGISDMDVSIVNGESTPSPAGPGTRLQAGTLNLTGALTVVATAGARDSFLAEIMGLMEAAEGGRARYRKIADRAAEIYAPAVHILAAAAFLGWMLYSGDWQHALTVAIAVLIITCPCALGLAVPVVQVVAAGRLFANGIMVKDGSAMERLAEVDTVLFDKTGTLTLGKPKLVNRSDVSSNHLGIASALAANSRHPLSQALVQAVGAGKAKFDVVREIAGAGLEAENGEGLWRLGSAVFAAPDDAAALAADDAAGPQTVLSLNGKMIAVFRFEDELRRDVAASLKALKAKRMLTGILSGDRESVVRALAQKLQINFWRAGLSPKGKVEEIRAAAAHEHKVLMVGDGINDAPALSAAHVSMAPATASDVGRQAADFVFLHESLSAVPLAIEVSRKAGGLIRQNFGFAIAYNAVFVPLALAGIATPLIAAIAMSTSSIVVVVNALRLSSRRAVIEASNNESALKSTAPVTA
jgi:P-type Cu2+ transporter